MSSDFRIHFDGSPTSIRHGGRVVPEYVRSAAGDVQAAGGDDGTYRSGYDDGRKEWCGRLEGLLGRLGDELQGLAGYREDLVGKFEENLVDLALAVAEKLLHQEIEEGRTRVGVLVHGLLGSLDLEGEAGRLTVRLHPDDLARLREEGGLGDREGIPERIEFVPDEAVEPGGCALDTEFGRVAYDVEKQLRELREFLQRGPGSET